MQALRGACHHPGTVSGIGVIMAFVQIPMSELKRLDALVLEQRRLLKEQEEMIARMFDAIDRTITILHRGRGTVPE